MGFYAKHVLPRLIELAMRNKEAARLRAIWIPRARGKVLEIGIGSGLNLPFYSAGVKSIIGVDPSLELQRLARARAARGKIPVEFLLQSAAEPLPIEAGCVDTAVSTWSLCSVPDAAAALGQIRRALQPDGRFIFVEHGCAPAKGVVAWQNRLTPCWKRIAGGCRLNRKMDELIRGAGFEITELKNEYLPGPRPMTYTYEGIAVKARS